MPGNILPDTDLKSQKALLFLFACLAYLHKFNVEYKSRIRLDALISALAISKIGRDIKFNLTTLANQLKTLLPSLDNLSLIHI